MVPWPHVTTILVPHDLNTTPPPQDDASKHPFNPLLDGTANMGLTDFIVKERLFNFYLVQGCIPGTDEYALQSEMASSGVWPTPITVYGYDNTFPIAGDLFEAETDCNREHNMGQVASSGVNNLAYFSRKPSISTPQPQNPPTMASDAAYDPTKVSVLGDFAAWQPTASSHVPSMTPAGAPVRGLTLK